MRIVIGSKVVRLLIGAICLSVCSATAQEPVPAKPAEQAGAAEARGSSRTDWETQPGLIEDPFFPIALPWYTETMVEFEGYPYKSREEAVVAMLEIQVLAELLTLDELKKWSIGHDFVPFTEQVRVRRVEFETVKKTFKDPEKVDKVDREFWGKVWERRYDLRLQPGWENHWRFRIQVVYRDYHHKEKAK